MNLAFFAPHTIAARCWERVFSFHTPTNQRSPAASSETQAGARAGPPRVAIWRVNSATGRIQCHVTADPHEIAEWLSRPWIERVGLILAAAQQSRFGVGGCSR